MKKLFTALLLFAISAFAASWDGTRGSITLYTVSDNNTTLIVISSTDQSIASFRVTATLIDHSTTTQMCSKAQVNGGAAFAAYVMPPTQISTVTVEALRVVETQTF